MVFISPQGHAIFHYGMKLIQEKIIIACGVLLIVLPFSGFPRNWKTVISFIIGVLIVYLGSLVFKKNSQKNTEQVAEIKRTTFTEIV
ncbi:MAG: hypothetical protein KBC17_00865 [Candidatus Pacebacteria bacterium]|nr:hypothetical protein [Candidatus Paceibacterota bacterium]